MSNVGVIYLYISPARLTSLSKTQFPSLAICANAARSCGHVLDVQARRGRGLLHYPSLMVIKHLKPNFIGLRPDRQHYLIPLLCCSSTFGQSSVAASLELQMISTVLQRMLRIAYAFFASTNDGESPTEVSSISLSYEV